MAPIKNTTIVIFGGTSGIGYGVADKCLSEGAIVHISSSNSSRITQAVSSLKEKYPSGQVTGHTCDLSLPDVEDRLHKLFEEIGSCDHIVYTAGDALSIKPLKDVDIQFVQKAGHIRFVVPVLIAKFALRFLKPGYTSSLTFTGGAVANKPQPDWAVIAGYSAGLYGMVQGLALDMKPLRVNFVSPGPVKTGLFSDEVADFLATRTTLGKVGSPEEVAEAQQYEVDVSTSTYDSVDHITMESVNGFKQDQVIFLPQTRQLLTLMTIIRDVNTTGTLFTSTVQKIARQLITPALESVPTEKHTIQTPVGETFSGWHPEQQVCGVILVVVFQGLRLCSEWYTCRSNYQIFDSSKTTKPWFQLISLIYRGGFNLFRPRTVPYDHEDYNLEVLKQQFCYFGRFPEKYEEIASRETVMGI
ncbi:hypothetical protein CNMCM5793_000994 [Aspergillus hiratsukae]|uniref:Phosphoribosyltransferase domain-containing protein n=1 Tax=Aspergillus hiratsukae TaxID=1194566 RepID=A0A8H6PBS1_9EURO|nr:hypothetical protein CNMCM5793_000994 [Aspergillus hiratsukae]KAF7156992.1 hypothetical protein CNMCM6106_001771 [Aspergillus hiratsukae]